MVSGGSHERLPKEEQERKAYANQVGADGWMLLTALEAPATPDWMRTLPAIITLRTMWEQQFEPRAQGGRWRQEPDLPATQLIASPYEPFRAQWEEESHRLARVQSACYESPCDEEAPQLITHVQTTPAPPPR